MAWATLATVDDVVSATLRFHAHTNHLTHSSELRLRTLLADLDPMDVRSVTVTAIRAHGDRPGPSHHTVTQRATTVARVLLEERFGCGVSLDSQTAEWFLGPRPGQVCVTIATRRP